MSRWLVMAVLIGCGRSPPSFVVRDSAGVAVVENLAPAAPGLISVDSVPLLEIGDSVHELSTWMRVVWLANDNIVVADPARRDLTWFGADGRFLRQVGREGAGPGEFRQFDLLANTADSVFTYDLALRRVTVFDTAGRFGRVASVLDADSSGTTVPAVVTTRGKLLMVTYGQPQGQAGLRRDSVEVAIGSTSGAIEARLGRFPWADEFAEFTKDGWSLGRVPFQRVSHWAAVDTLFLVATNERFGYRLFDARGQLRQSVGRVAESMPSTAADVDAQLAEWFDELPSGMEARKEEMRRYYTTVPRPPHKPYYDQVFALPGGEVWIREYHEPGQRAKPSIYSVFDASGVWLTQVTIPAGATPVSFKTDRVLTLWRDADGVTRLRIYRLNRAPRTD